MVYDALAPRLFGYLFRQTRDRSRAEDLLQQTMLHIHRARDRFITGAEVMPWAFAIARRLLVDEVRRNRRVVLSDHEEPEARASTGAPRRRSHASERARRAHPGHPRGPPALAARRLRADQARGIDAWPRPRRCSERRSRRSSCVPIAPTRRFARPSATLAPASRGARAATHPLPSPELRARVLDAVHREAVRSRPAGLRRRARAVAFGFTVPLAILALSYFRGPPAHERPHGYIAALALAWVPIAAVATWAGVGQGGSMLGRPRRALWVATLTPVALLLTWAAAASVWPSTLSNPSGPPQHVVCNVMTVVFAVGPLAAFAVLRRRSNPVNPRITGAAIAAASAAWAALDASPALRVHVSGAHSSGAHRACRAGDALRSAMDRADGGDPGQDGVNGRVLTRPMNVLMVSSEVESLARTGGLGDAVEALSRVARVARGGRPHRHAQIRRDPGAGGVRPLARAGRGPARPGARADAGRPRGAGSRVRPLLGSLC